MDAHHNGHRRWVIIVIPQFTDEKAETNGGGQSSEAVYFPMAVANKGQNQERGPGLRGCKPRPLATPQIISLAQSAQSSLGHRRKQLSLLAAISSARSCLNIPRSTTRSWLPPASLSPLPQAPCMHSPSPVTGDPLVANPLFSTDSLPLLWTFGSGDLFSGTCLPHGAHMALSLSLDPEMDKPMPSAPPRSPLFPGSPPTSPASCLEREALGVM